jgi:hypothetical protein
VLPPYCVLFVVEDQTGDGFVPLSRRPGVAGPAACGSGLRSNLSPAAPSVAAPLIPVLALSDQPNLLAQTVTVCPWRGFVA